MSNSNCMPLIRTNIRTPIRIIIHTMHVYNLNCIYLCKAAITLVTHTLYAIWLQICLKNHSSLNSVIHNSRVRSNIYYYTRMYLSHSTTNMLNGVSYLFNKLSSNHVVITDFKRTTYIM
jgi:hypothetical protein